MTQLQDIILKESAQIVPDLASKAIARKMAERGIIVSEKDRGRLAEQISEGVTRTYHFQEWKFWDQRTIHVGLTDEDVRLIEEKSLTIIDKLPSIVESIADDVTSNLITDLKKRWPRQRRLEQRALKPFERNLARKWKGPLDLLSIILAIANELGASINHDIRARSEISVLTDVLTRLHGRACQVAGEVINLLNSGYADGAMARWRTLHEIAVVALFIQTHGEECANRYLQHSHVESYRAALNYERYRDRLGGSPMEQSEIDDLRMRYDQLSQRFGSAFLEPYGWAAAALGNSKPKFSDIEQNVAIDHLRPYYKMASYNVHPNSRGIFFRLGLLPEADLILAGPSNFGLADPGQFTAISLGQASSALAALNPTLDAIISVKVILALSSEAATSFAAVQNEIEQEEMGGPLGQTAANNRNRAAPRLERPR